MTGYGDWLCFYWAIINNSCRKVQWYIAVCGCGWSFEVFVLKQVPPTWSYEALMKIKIKQINLRCQEKLKQMNRRMGVILMSSPHCWLQPRLESVPSSVTKKLIDFNQAWSHHGLMHTFPRLSLTSSFLWRLRLETIKILSSIVLNHGRWNRWKARTSNQATLYK